MVVESKKIINLAQNIANLEKNFVDNNKHNWQSIPELWNWCAQEYKTIIALVDPHHTPSAPINYEQLNQLICQFASALQSLGFKKGDTASIFSENSSRWLIADQGILTSGGINAVRSSNASIEELSYILDHSDSSVLVVEDIQTYEKLKNNLSSKIKYIIVLWGDTTDIISDISIFSFNKILSLGKKNCLKQVNIDPNDEATIIYTSGTTGKPKGVVLTHGNILCQLDPIDKRLNLTKGNKLISILPPWHAYERTAEYYILSRGLTLIYTNVKKIKQDLVEYEPDAMIGVPRIWESLYDGINQFIDKQSLAKKSLIKLFLKTSEIHFDAQQTISKINSKNLKPNANNIILANLTKIILEPINYIANKIVYSKIRENIGNLRIGASGGGSLAVHIDKFFNMIGIKLLVGYGLTETAPILTLRRPDRNIIGSIGDATENTLLKIIHPETKKELSKGQKGVILAKGPQLMKGYYKNQEATDKVIDKDGWFNTGDIGCMYNTGEIVITGRIKEIIVLSNGEKVEPTPIEDACLKSKFISQIMLVGQDKKNLGALIVPNIEHFENIFDNFCKNSKKVEKHYKKELNKIIKNRENYSSNDKIGVFKFVKEPFTIENGLLTQTLKVKREKVNEAYQHLIKDMFN